MRSIIQAFAIIIFKIWYYLSLIFQRLPVKFSPQIPPLSRSLASSWKSSPSVQVQCLWENCSMGSQFCWEGSVLLTCFLVFAHERAEMDVFGLSYFARVLVFCFHHTSLTSLDRAQSCKSEWNLLFLILFSDLSNLVFWVFLRKAGGVVTQCWTLSNVFESNSRCGFQIDEANSRCSLTNAG